MTGSEELQFRESTSSPNALRIKKKSLLSRHVQTQPPHRSPVSSHLRAKQVFPKTLWCHNTALPWEVLRPVSAPSTPNNGRFHAGHLSDNNYARSSGAGKNAAPFSCTHGETSTELLPLCARYFLSVWPIESLDNNEQAC